MQQTFAQSLGNFKFQTIGEQTEDEKMISKDKKCVTDDTGSHFLDLYYVVKGKNVIQLRPLKYGLCITSHLS